jgi:Cytochrome c7 and related cytochrome c/Class III cytochrome C family
VRWVRISLVILICVIAVLAQKEKLPGPEQPIPFSHKLHAGEQKLNCATCHKNSDAGAKMGLPSAAMCMQCHSDIKAESPEIQKIAVFAKENREIGWRRVYQVPSYVRFNHRSHLDAGGACATCHGNVAEFEQMYLAVKINMPNCIKCHEENGARTGCSYCHKRMK